MKKILSSTIVVVLLLTVIAPSRLVYTYAYANDSTNEEIQIVQEEEQFDGTAESTTAILPEINIEEVTSEASREEPDEEPETEGFEPIEYEFNENIFNTILIDVMPLASTFIPVNDETTLENAITVAAASGIETDIELLADIELAGGLSIPSNTSLKIRSEIGEHYRINKKSVGRHFSVEGELTLENIILESDNPTSVQEYGGIMVNAHGILNLKAGAVIQKCHGIYGGAVQVTDHGSFNLLDGELKDNVADSYGGGVRVEEDARFVMSGGSIYNNNCNGAGGGGGAVHINGGSFIMTGGELRDNTADTYAGAVYIDANGGFTIDGTAEISGNKAVKGGGVLLYHSQLGDTDGAGTFTMNGGLIHDNTALTTGIGGGVLIAADDGVFTMNGGSISKNVAPHGGGIYILAGTVDLVSGDVKDNIAEANGGGIYGHTDTTLTITGGEVSRNKATSGAGIYDIGAITITNGTIAVNTAEDTGGGIYAREINVTSSDIWGNSAKHGAGIHINNYFATQAVQQQYISTISDSLINYNSAEVQGGAISVNAGTVVLENNTRIKSNMAYGKGGGLYLGGISEPYLSATARLEMKNSTVSNNGISDSGVIGNQGGAIYILGDTNAATPDAVIEDSSITWNYAEYGGGILSYEGSILIKDSDIDDNSGTKDGGGIYLFNGALLEIGGTSNIRNNQAPNGKGGGIFNAKSTYKNVATDYDNLTIAIDTKFTGNTAKAQFNPPANAQALYPNIKFDEVSVKSHPLNDYDINYYFESSGEGGGGGTTEGTTSEGTTEMPSGTTEGNTQTVTPSSKYTVTYSANGGKGLQKRYTVEYGDSHFVLSAKDTGYTFDGYRFVEWNTQPDGGGEAYKIDDVLVVTEPVTLYAQWIEDDGTADESGGASASTEAGREKQTTIRPGIRRPVGSPSTGVEDTVIQHFLGLGISFLVIVSLIWTSKKRAE